MHKTVLALAIGAAVTDGVIPSLDSKASRWLTEWQGDARRDVTVEDLLIPIKAVFFVFGKGGVTVYKSSNQGLEIFSFPRSFGALDECHPRIVFRNLKVF